MLTLEQKNGDFLMCITLELMGITICFQRTANYQGPLIRAFERLLDRESYLRLKGILSRPARGRIPLSKYRPCTTVVLNPQIPAYLRRRQ